MKKYLKKEYFILWISLAMLICAALNLNASLNLLAGREQRKHTGLRHSG